MQFVRAGPRHRQAKFAARHGHVQQAQLFGKPFQGDLLF